MLQMIASHIGPPARQGDEGRVCPLPRSPNAAGGSRGPRALLQTDALLFISPFRGAPTQLAWSRGPQALFPTAALLFTAPAMVALDLAPETGRRSPTPARR